MYYFKHSPLVKLLLSGHNISQPAKINTNLMLLNIVRNKSMGNPTPSHDLSTIRPTAYNWYTLARVLAYTQNPLFTNILQQHCNSQQQSQYIKSIQNKQQNYYSLVKSLIQSCKYDLIDLYMLLDKNYKHHIELRTLQFVVSEDNFIPEEIRKRIKYIQMVVETNSTALFQQKSDLSMDDRMIIKSIDQNGKMLRLRGSPAVTNIIVDRMTSQIVKQLSINNISAQLKMLFQEISKLVSAYIEYGKESTVRHYVIMIFCYKLLQCISQILQSCQLNEQFKGEISKKIYKMHLELPQKIKTMDVSGLDGIIQAIKLPTVLKMLEKDYSWSKIEQTINKYSIEELLVIESIYSKEEDKWPMHMVHKAIREKIDISQVQSLYLHYFQKKIRKIVGTKVHPRMSNTVRPATLVYLAQRHSDLAEALTRCKNYHMNQSS